jgi:hypothetical protein
VVTGALVQVLFVLDTNLPIDVDALADDIRAANPKTGSG